VFYAPALRGHEMKRLLLLMALVFALATATPAFAAGNDHGHGNAAGLGIDHAPLGGGANSYSIQADSPIYVF
ncbi:MAG TPA: hypothetical protein VFK80_10910, partial [Limnochordia bacterium]|nr:hypothetical protein [Limnochordia bacterium]